MTTLNKLTVRRLKMNKKRTIVTIFGIVLSTALICAVAGMVTSFQSTLKKHAIDKTGNFHIFMNDISKDDLKYIEKNQQIKDFFYVQDIGYSSLENSQNPGKPYLRLREYDEKALHGYGIALTEGRLPQNSNEVILSSAILKNGGVSYKIGDKITLNLGKRVFESGADVEEGDEASATPFQTCGDSKDETCEEEHLEVFETREVTVVGFMERPAYGVEATFSPGYTIISKLDSNRGWDYTHAAILFKHPKEYRHVLDDLKNALNQEELSYYFNDELLRYEGVLSGGTMNVLVTVSSVVFAIIIVSSVFVIKNSFTISVTERIREYGMLASIGATKKQIRKSVLFEGFLLGMIGIPLGIFSGILAVLVLVLLLNLILGEFIHNFEFVCHVPFIALLLSVGLSGITIYLSSIFPARRAAKIAPIEAIRGNAEVPLKRKNVKTPKLFKRIFSVGGDIAYKNLKRSRKKYRTTVVSLVVSIVMFLGLSALLDYGFRYTNIYYREVNYNVSVWMNRSARKGDYELVQEITKLAHGDEYALHRSIDLDVSAETYVNPKLLATYFSDNAASVTVLSLGDLEYNTFLKHLGLNPETYKNKAVLIDQVYIYMNDKYHDVRYLNVQEGDKIVGKSYGDESTISLEIGKITKERPIGLSEHTSTAYLIVSDEMMDTLAHDAYSILYVDSKDPDKFVREFENLQAENKQYGELVIQNLNDSVRENNAFILVISIFLYGFITVITLIGVTNIFNTITTNMFLRKREFAMLRSIGMTNKEFKRMIRLESIFYGLKSLCFGIPIGMLVGYFIYKGVRNNLETTFVIPYFQIILCIFFVMIIVGITMRYSLRKIQKENIIEVIRNDNI